MSKMRGFRDSPPSSPGRGDDRVRHNSKSSTDSSIIDEKEKRPSAINDRLLNLSVSRAEVAESREKTAKGDFLKREIEKYIVENKRENGEDEPTEDEIKKQIFLPKDVDSFKEPIKEWVETPDTSIVPGWNKSLLPEEEIIKPPDWRPPTPPRVDLRLTPFIERAKKENEEEIVEIKPVVKEITPKATSADLRDLRDDDVILVMSGCGFVRTTKKSFLDAKDTKPIFGDRGDGGRWEGRGGGRGRGGRGGRGGGHRDRSRDRGDDRRRRDRSRDRDSDRHRRDRSRDRNRDRDGRKSDRRDGDRKDYLRDKMNKSRDDDDNDLRDRLNRSREEKEEARDSRRASGSSRNHERSNRSQERGRDDSRSSRKYERSDTRDMSPRRTESGSHRSRREHEDRQDRYRSRSPAHHSSSSSSRAHERSRDDSMDRGRSRDDSRDRRRPRDDSRDRGRSRDDSRDRGRSRDDSRDRKRPRDDSRNRGSPSLDRSRTESSRSQVSAPRSYAEYKMMMAKK